MSTSTACGRSWTTTPRPTILLSAPCTAQVTCSWARDAYSDNAFALSPREADAAVPGGDVCGAGAVWAYLVWGAAIRAATGQEDASARPRRPADCAAER